jgi:O-antigen/teichoic acid export membrane protein
LSGLLARLRRLIELLKEGTPDLSTPEGRAAERERRMFITVGASLGSKVISLFVQFAVVGLLARHLGKLSYGVWATLVSLIGWLNLVQLGVGPSLINELSSLTSKDDRAEARRFVATAWWVQMALALGIGVVAAVAWPFIPWGVIVNTSSPAMAEAAGLTAAVILGAALLRLPLSLLSTVFNAHQRGYIDALWNAGAAVVTLAAVWFVTREDAGMASVTLAQRSGPVLVAAVACFVVFRGAYRHLAPSPRFVRRREAKRLIGVGIHFTIATVSATIINSTDNLVITQVIGPEAVTPYAVTFMLTQVANLVVMLLLNAAWPAYVEAAAHRDVAWLMRTHRRLSISAAVILFTSAAGILVLGRPFLAWWAGPEAVPSFALLSSIVLLSTVQGLFLCTGRLITALGAVNITGWVGATNAVVNLAASLVLAHYLGVVGVALGTVFGYVATGWVLFPIARKKLQELSADGHGAVDH